MKRDHSATGARLRKLRAIGPVRPPRASGEPSLVGSNPGFSPAACWLSRSRCIWRPGPCRNASRRSSRACPLLHGVHLRLGRGALHLQVAGVDLRHTNAVAQRKNDLLSFLLCPSLTRELYLVALHVDGELAGIKPVVLDLLLLGVGGCS